MTTLLNPASLTSNAAHDHMIRYPRFLALHRDIRTCQELSQMTGEAHCMSLEGPPGAGKTTLVRDYASLFPPEEGPDGMYFPVFYLQMPSPATIKGTASKWLARMGDPAAYRGTQASLDARLINLIIACRVRLIILDDFHQLIDTESDRVLARVSDWLKVLMKETTVSFLVVGIEGKVERILRANAQLSRLFAVRETLSPFAWDWSDPETMSEFHHFVHYAEQLVGLPLTTDLPREEILSRLHYATDGIVANLMNMLRSAALYARDTAEDKLSLDTLDHAFNKRLAKHLPNKTNPFTATHGAHFHVPIGVVGTDTSTTSTSERKRREPTVGQVLTTR